MDLLYHHGIYLIIFKVFNRLLDVPLVIYISLLMPLTYLLFFWEKGWLLQKQHCMDILLQTFGVHIFSRNGNARWKYYWRNLKNIFQPF